MSDELKYTTFKTALGWVGILASPAGLLSTTLPQNSAEEAYQLLGINHTQVTCYPCLFEDLTDRLQTYLSGGKTSFLDKLDLSAATFFQRKVWEKTRLIPYGETRSYQRVAEQTGSPGAARAVGQALGRNPLPIIIPCHRVIASDGRLGGFSGGLEIKRRLLRLEAVTDSC
ncbi:MAG: MGMT family protein [Dehalococcoidales bacterium]|nr:MAG: MGMT family protein [Dehalococcoidales bacterium]